MAFTPSCTSTPASRFIKACERSQNIMDTECIKEMEESLKDLTSDCINGRISYFLDHSSDIFFDQLYRFLSGMRGAVTDAQHLGSRLSAIFTFVKEAGKHELLRPILRDTYGMLQFLAEFFDPEAPIIDRVLVMDTIELLSRDIVISWKAPYLQILVKKAFVHMLKSPVVPSVVHNTLQFFINICRQNSTGVLIVRADENYKHGFRIIGNSCLIKETENENGCLQRTKILFSHLMFLVGSIIPIDDFYSGYELVNSSTTRALFRRKEQLLKKEDTREHTFLSESLYEVTELMLTIIEKMKPVYLNTGTEEFAKVPRYNVAELDKFERSKKSFVITVVTILYDLRDWMVDIKNLHVEDLKAVLKMVLILYPTYVPRDHLVEAYKAGLKIGSLALRFSSGDPSVFPLALAIYQHIIEQILEDRHKILSQFIGIDEYFILILDIARISTEIYPAYVQQNTLLARLLFSLSSYPGVRENVANKLDFELINEFTNNLLQSETVSNKERLDQSVCLVELLCTLAQYTDVPEIVDLFMKMVSKRSICDHIANCIHNGDERATTKALSVIGSAPFDHSKLPLVTNSLIALRHQPCVTPGPNCCNNNELDPTACGAANKLSSTIALIEESLENGTGEVRCQMSDLMSWYRMKNHLNEMEMDNLVTQMYHLNKTKAQLRYLLDQQTEFVTKLVNQSEKDSMDVTTLRNRLDEVTNELKSKTSVLQKELNQIKISYNQEKESASNFKEKLRMEEAANETLKKEFIDLQAAKEELTKKCSTTLDEKRSWRAEAVRSKNELTQSKIKVTSLEENLKKTEEERANVYMLFEKEKKMLNTIRGLVQP